MLDVFAFYNALTNQGIEFFTGVPDSILKGFCTYLSNHKNENHIVAANEGGAIGLATGYHLATGKIPLVYMQNSGLGNAVNPLVSLVDSSVYSIPMLLLIGWRGEPGTNDEPQHIKQGEITLKLLDLLGIPYLMLLDSNEEAEKCVKESIRRLKPQHYFNSGQIYTKNRPVALIVKKYTFGLYEMRPNSIRYSKLVREEAVKTVHYSLDEYSIIVSTTGKISREVYEQRNNFYKYFYNIGAMGHTSQIALGIARSKPDKQVYCFDGDGAAIMHMGALGIIGSSRAKNFKHIIFNNGCHDSVGGQPTCGFAISFTDIARACGYTLALQAKTEDEVKKKIQLLKLADGPAMLEIIVKKGARDNLERPKILLKEQKIKFMGHLGSIRRKA